MEEEACNDEGANVQEPTKSDAQETIHFVGERNAIVFSAAAGEPLPPVELPDDFFHLNKDDVRVLYKELKQTREEMENLPFRTKAVREMESSADTLSRLRRYTQTVLRVQFPDQLVLQAVFNHSDTVLTVMEFTRQFLQTSDVQFQLYTAPPKSILRPETTLIDAKLTPRALMYFSAQSPTDQTTFLQESLLTTLTTPRLASQAALQYRREEVEEERVEEPVKVSEEPTRSYRETNAPSTSKKAAAASTKVPKWKDLSNKRKSSRVITPHNSAKVSRSESPAMSQQRISTRSTSRGRSTRHQEAQRLKEKSNCSEKVTPIRPQPVKTSKRRATTEKQQLSATRRKVPPRVQKEKCPTVTKQKPDKKSVPARNPRGKSDKNKSKRKK